MRRCMIHPLAIGQVEWVVASTLNGETTGNVLRHLGQAVYNWKTVDISPCAIDVTSTVTAPISASLSHPCPVRGDAITDEAPPGGALLKTLHEGGDGFIQGQFPESDVQQLQTLMKDFDETFELTYASIQRKHSCSTNHKCISKIGDKCETCLADALTQLSFNAVCNNDSDSKGSDVAMPDGTPNPLTLLRMYCSIMSATTNPNPNHNGRRI